MNHKRSKGGERMVEVSFERIVDLDGDLLRCIYPGCNIDTNIRYMLYEQPNF